MTTYKSYIILNMIVRNESAIIRRCMESVVGLIDAYCIQDTGSTDDTVDIIKTYMKSNNIPGEIHHTVFRDFGYNRTLAIKQCMNMCITYPYNMSDIQYMLFMDADMVLHMDDGFDINTIRDPVHMVKQYNGNLVYDNVRLVRTDVHVKCVGATHEYYTYPVGTTVSHLRGMYINDIGDGGSKSTKYSRDISLLTATLASTPNDPRTIFYLAQSYVDLGRSTTPYNVDMLKYGISMYEKYLLVGTWDEEIYYAHYRIGTTYMNLGMGEHGIVWLLKAYGYRPTRAEPLYELCRYYRIHGQYNLAYTFYTIGRMIPYSSDTLFVDEPVYTYLFDYELSIIAYYIHTGIHMDIVRLSIDLLNRVPINIGYNVCNNLPFYIKPIIGNAIITKDYTNTVRIGHGIYYSSTPSIWKGNGAYSYGMNVRYVNYYIKSDGSYTNKETISSKNVLLYLNDDLECTYHTPDVGIPHHIEYMSDQVHTTLKYDGVEDIKVYPNNGKLLCIGTAQDPVGNSTLRMAYGTYSIASIDVALRDTPTGSQCEKNWAIYGEDKVIHSWYPLRSYDISTYTPTPIHTKQTLDLYRYVRGSTNGYHKDGYIWFVNHIVANNTSRIYVHMITVLDQDLNIIKHSIPFTFEGISIEFCLGIIVEDDRVLLSYSTMDRTTKVAVFGRKYIEGIMYTLI